MLQTGVGKISSEHFAKPWNQILFCKIFTLWYGGGCKRYDQNICCHLNWYWQFRWQVFSNQQIPKKQWKLACFYWGENSLVAPNTWFKGNFHLIHLTHTQQTHKRDNQKSSAANLAGDSWHHLQIWPRGEDFQKWALSKSWQCQKKCPKVDPKMRQ